jgi:zinc transport system substrate-binding protein
MRVILTIVLELLVAASFFTACGNTGAADGGRLQVVTSFYPLEEAAARAGGDRVDVQDLTPPGVEPHDLELTPGDLEAIGSADLVIYLGGGFQPAVEDAVASAATGSTIDVLSVVGQAEPLLPDAEGELTDDPHVWLDPQRYAVVVGAVADALDRADPDGAAGFDRNGSTFEEELATLDDEFRRTLEPCRGDLLVTGHEAFGYLAQRYGLEQVGVTGVSPEAEPTPDRVAEIRSLVEHDHVTTVFAEAQLPSDAVETIARETGATVAVLNPIESLTDEERANGQDYGSVMGENLAAMKEGLPCDGG